MRLIPLLFAVSLLAYGSDQGVAPRAAASDYPVHQTFQDAMLAVAIVPVKQIERMFSPDTAKHYVVLEIAVYPENSQTVDVERLDFGLKLGDTVVYSEKPGDIATPWPEKNRVPNKPVTVITDTGVVYSKSSDPVNGKRSGWGVYEGVGVTNDPRAVNPPPLKQGPAPQIVEDRVRETILPEGPTRVAVAGYLFFPQYTKHKGDAMEVQWRRNGSTVTLPLPRAVK